MPTLPLDALALLPVLSIVALFDVVLRGELATLLIMAAIFLLSAVTFGVLLAAVTRITQQALLLTFVGLFPQGQRLARVVAASPGTARDRQHAVRPGRGDVSPGLL